MTRTGSDRGSRPDQASTSLQNRAEADPPAFNFDEEVAESRPAAGWGRRQRREIVRPTASVNVACHAPQNRWPQRLAAGPDSLRYESNLSRAGLGIYGVSRESPEIAGQLRPNRGRREPIQNTFYNQIVTRVLRSRSRVICATPAQKRAKWGVSEWFLCCVCRVVR